MRTIALALLLASVSLAGGCGDDDADNAASAPAPAAEEEAAGTEQAAREKEGARGGGEGEAKGGQDGGGATTTIVAGDSEFGEMLYDSNDQAIYVFENDGEGPSTCYEECAAAWPPVLSSAPVAGEGVERSLLATTERRDGTTQVTYDGKPLYFYAHEAPGEVRCHNVDLNGGFWWVLGPDGERLP